MNSNELGILVIIAAAEALALFAEAPTSGEWLRAIERMAEYKRAWDAALEAEKAICVTCAQP